MKQTPIPLLRELTPGVVVHRCVACRELVLVSELCGSESEALRCAAYLRRQSHFQSHVSPQSHNPAKK